MTIDVRPRQPAARRRWRSPTPKVDTEAYSSSATTVTGPIVTDVVERRLGRHDAALPRLGGPVARQRGRPERRCRGTPTPRTATPTRSSTKCGRPRAPACRHDDPASGTIDYDAGQARRRPSRPARLLMPGGHALLFTFGGSLQARHVRHAARSPRHQHRRPAPWCRRPASSCRPSTSRRARRRSRRLRPGAKCASAA